MNSTDRIAVVKPMLGLPVNLEADPKDFPPPEWTIRTLMVEEQINLLLAPVGWGKTMLALQAMLATAQGSRWLGQPSIRRRTLYLCPEMTTGQLLHRCLRIAPNMNGDGKMAALAGSDRVGRVNMAWEAHVNAIKNLMLSGKCEALILDTFRQCSVGNENDSGMVADWSQGVRELLRGPAKGGVLVLHHPRKEDDDAPKSKLLTRGYSARGSGELMGCAENVVCGVQIEDEKYLVWSKWRGDGWKPKPLKLRQASTGEFMPADSYMKDPF